MSSLALRPARWCAVLLVATTMSGRAAAQPLAERVPAEAMVYIGWAGIESMPPEFEGSHFQGFFKAVDVPRLSAQVLGVVRNFAQADAQMGPAVDVMSQVVAAMWRHPTAFYFAGVDTRDPAQPMPRLALMCRMGDGAEALRDRIIAAAGPPPQEIVLQAADGMLIFAMGMTLDEAVRPATALAGSARFKEAMGLVHAPAVAVGYADVPAIKRAVVDIAGQVAAPDAIAMAEKVIESLGVNGLGRVIASAGFSGKDWQTAAFVEAPAPRKGLLKLLDSGPIDESSLRVIPSTAAWMSAARFDLAQAYEVVRQAVVEIEPQAAAMLDQGLEMGRQQVGFDIVNDFIRALGTDWVLYSDVSLGRSPASTFALVHPLRDAVKFDASLTMLEEKVAPMLEGMGEAPGLGMLRLHRAQAGDMTVRSINIFIYAISWAVHDGRFFISLFPQTVAAAAENAKGEGPTILDQPKFQGLMRRLGKRPVSSVTYADLERTAPEMYQLAMMGAQMLQAFGGQQGRDIQPLMLPPLGRLMPYFHPTASIGWADERGFHSRSLSPYPGSTAFTPTGAMTSLPAMAMVGAGLTPGFAGGIRGAEGAVSANRIKTILNALIMYAFDHKRQFPPDLGTLVKEGYLRAEDVVNPRAHHNPKPPRGATPGELAMWANENSGFVLLPVTRLGDRYRDELARNPDYAHGLLVYEKIQPGVTDFLNFGFQDGSVRRYDGESGLRALRSMELEVPATLPKHTPGPAGFFEELFGGRSQRQPPAAAVGEAWYYDTVTQEYFRDKTTRVPPFTRDNGNQAVRAHFFTCGNCTDEERFIGYYEKYTDEVKRKLEERAESFALYEMAFQGRLYSADGKTWFPAERPEGTRITADLQKKCPPKKLRYCPPD